MTTIAYSAREGKMLGDTRAFGFNKGPVGVKEKVVYLDGGCLLGVSTNGLGLADAVVRWVRDGMPPNERPVVEKGDWCEVLLVHPDGSATLMDKTLAPARVKADHYAVGSGKDYAVAALHLGHSLVDALRVACDLDVWSDWPLVGYDHDGQKHELASPADVRQYRLTLIQSERDAR
jgi:hypothetical protein